MTAFSDFLSRLDGRIESWTLRFRGKKIRYYPTLVGAGCFFLLSVGIFVLMPAQIKVQPDQTINARTFPAVLAAIMLFGSIYLGGKDLYRLIRRLPVEDAELDLLTELRAAAILGLLILFALLMKIAGFIPSAVVFSLLMLRYFKIRSFSYHALVAAAAVLIGVVFRYVLNVRLP